MFTPKYLQHSPLMDFGRGRHSQFFFVKNLGLALAPKMCPDQSQAFKEVNNSQTGRRQKKWPILFSGRPAPRCSKAYLYKVSRKYSKNWLRRINIKSNLTPEFQYTLKPSNNDTKPGFLHFFARKSKCPRRFGETWPCDKVPVRLISGTWVATTRESY